MGFIDCDGHVQETYATWDYFDPNERDYKPQVVDFEDKTRVRLGARAAQVALPRTPSKLWLMGDTWARFAPSHGAFSPHVNSFGPGLLDLTDPAGRVKVLDALGIDAQVIFSTIFIGAEIDNPLEEAAIYRSYNRWVAEHLSGYTDRLQWAVKAPTRYLERAFEELKYGKEHGAVGIMLKGIEHGYYLSDPYFFPLYERAQELDLAILIHNGGATRAQSSIPIGNYVPQAPALAGSTVNIMSGLYAVIGSEIPQKFPRLRWGFIEGGGYFALSVIHQNQRRDMSIGSTRFLDVERLPSEAIAEMNIHISIETDENVSFLAEFLGEKALCVGTDFGHNDLGSELGAHQTVLARSDISSSTARMIVSDNGRRLLNIPADFCPAPTPTADRNLPGINAVAGGPAIVVPTWVAERESLSAPSV
jgi:predicted TIM-barrel fold metal-dependent hydrolase